MINKKGVITLLITNFITLTLLLYSNWSIIVELFSNFDVNWLNFIITSILTFVVIIITIHNNIKTDKVTKKIANAELKLQIYEQRLFIYKSFIKINTKIISNYKFNLIKNISENPIEEERKLIEEIIKDSLELYEELIIAISLSKYLFNKEEFDYLKIIYDKYLIYRNRMGDLYSNSDLKQLPVINSFVDELDSMLNDDRFFDCFKEHLKFEEIE